MVRFIEYVHSNEGARVNVIAEKIGISEATAERHVTILKKIKFIEFNGAPKTGGYFLTEKLKKRLTK
ncbi:MAG: hypothetical protein A2309_02500 [Bacteroidetes bacterium RIFOXYB2_FULL_35_7]|nr:MAG: hypothetical protein A2309_02500 [Bacteroidetes bacterium RIFOXYB2_FULL_35_7]